MGRAIPTVREIQEAVARECRIPPALMRQPSPTVQCGANSRDISHPRQEAMTLAFLLTNHSRANIGRMFGGRDPTTVFYACAQVHKRRRSDPKVHARLRRVTLDLIGGR